jgi:hypothetical protein
MSLRDAFAGLGAQEPKGLGAQVPNGSGAQVRKKQNTGVLRLAALAQDDKRKSNGALPLPLQGTAKSRHPEFEAVKVYLRRNTHKLARRKCEDNGDGDFSDLVESLLQQYLGA